MNIAEVTPKEGCELLIRMENGRLGIFDAKLYLESEAFAPLKDRSEFERVRNGGYFIEWACGADLSADTIEARMRTIHSVHDGP